MKPVAEAAHPEYEFSIETTTGISAPPIAITKCIPNKSANNVIIIRELRALSVSTENKYPK